jgi:hypothetical protein
MLLPLVGPAEREPVNQDGLSPNDLSVLAHPIRYMKWRRDVRKSGPFAAAYNGGRAPSLTPVIALVICLVALGAAIAIIFVA